MKSLLGVTGSISLLLMTWLLTSPDISSHDIAYVEYVGPGRTWGRILGTCFISMWRNDIKCKCMFMFPLQNLARKELIYFIMTDWQHVKGVLFSWLSNTVCYSHTVLRRVRRGSVNHPRLTKLAELKTNDPNPRQPNNGNCSIRCTHWVWFHVWSVSYRVDK